MKIQFCKISSMLYYKGVSEKDVPYNGGQFVKENGYGLEQFNFEPICFKGKECCLGYVETKATVKSKSNQLHIELISGCEAWEKENSVDGVLVIWCATTDLNETSIVGWYKDATVFRQYQECEINSGYIQKYNVIAGKENCVLLPRDKRHVHKWSAPVARKGSYGFGQSMVWYANNNKEEKYIRELAENINDYSDKNWIDISAENLDINTDSPNQFLSF